MVGDKCTFIKTKGFVVQVVVHVVIWHVIQRIKRYTLYGRIQCKLLQRQGHFQVYSSIFIEAIIKIC